MLQSFPVRLNQANLDRIQNIVYTDQNLSRDQQFTKEKKDYMIQLIQSRGQELHEKITQNIIHVNLVNNQTSKEQLQLTREEIFTLLSMMYFQLFQREFMQGSGFYCTDMNYLKSQTYKSQQKLKCLFSYFNHYLENNQQIKSEKVTFTKRTQMEIIDLQPDQSSYADIKVFDNIDFSNGKNEDQKNAIIVDFADENICGLVLDPSNIAQEEVLMLIYPEAIVSMLFITPMEENQAILIENLIQYNDYQGYENTFQWKPKNFVRTDVNHMLAIDAKPFQSKVEQLSQQNILREFKKCYIGFSLALEKNKNYIISTGKWGCGIFNGDIYLKTLIQLAAFLKAAKKNNSPQSKLIINTVGDLQLNQFGERIKGQYTNLHLNDLISILQNMPQQDSSTNFLNLMEGLLHEKNEEVKQSANLQNNPFKRLWASYAARTTPLAAKIILRMIYIGVGFSAAYFFLDDHFRFKVENFIHRYPNSYRLGVLVVFFVATFLQRKTKRK